MIEVQALDHLVLTVRRVEATVAFYERLGLTPETFGQGRVALKFGVQKLNLHQLGEEIQPNARVATPGSADLSFLVAKPISEVLAELDRGGIPVELGPVERTGATGRILSVYFRDPDGNHIEFSQSLALNLSVLILEGA